MREERCGNAVIESIPPRAVDVAQIESELQSLWVEPHEGGAPLTRACMSNLIVVCDCAESARPMPDHIAEVVHQHPSRVLLLVAENGETAGVEASVSAQCHRDAEGRQVCSEHVALIAGGAKRRRLASVARALVIGDLPTALWWSAQEAPVFGGALFRELVEMADQLVYDSLGWDDAVTGLAETARWAANERAGQVVSDLAWRRLEPWRWLIAQALDSSVAPGALASIAEVVVEHSFDAMAEAWLLIAWIAARLGWKVEGGRIEANREIEWRLGADGHPVRGAVVQGGRSECGICRARVAFTREAGSPAFAVAEVAPGRLAITRDGETAARQTVSAPRLSRATLLARELARQCDPVFLETLALAAALAERLRQ